MKIIDLTLAYEPGMRGVDIKSARTLTEDGWNASTLTLYSHAGTHMDAPMHFEAGDETIDEIPLERCMGDAWVVKIQNCTERRLITPDDLEAITDKYRKGDSLIIHTGWSLFLGESRYRDALPRISEDLAWWCVHQEVKMLAVEPPSVADVHNLEELTHIHRILLEGGVTIVEGLTNVDKITEDQVQLFAIPLKIYRGDGAPARVFAITGNNIEKKTE